MSPSAKAYFDCVRRWVAEGKPDGYTDLDALWFAMDEDEMKEAEEAIEAEKAAGTWPDKER